jgi:SAM-dependent methyltransferase
MLSREGRLGRVMQRRWTDAETAYHAKILESLPQDPDALLLDIGCDDGEWTEEVRRKLGVRPQQVYGLEIVEERAALARRRGFDVATGNLDEPWPFEDAAFDVVHANQVIEHVVRLDHFVAELRRVLARDGVAVVCTENLASWHNVAAVALGYQPFSLTNVSSVRPIGNRFALHAGEPSSRGESWQHVHVLTLAGLRDVFAAHGFDVVTSWGTGYYPFSRRVASAFAARDPRHAHFIGLLARPVSAARAGRGARHRLPVGN